MNTGSKDISFRDHAISCDLFSIVLHVALSRMDGVSLFVNATVVGNASEVSLSGRRKSFGFSVEISFDNDIADSAFIRFWSITKLLDYDIKKGL